MNRRAALAFALIGFLWGSAWIPNSEVLKQAPALRAGALRFVIAAAFTALLAVQARRLVPGKTTATLFRDAFVLSLTALALPYALTVHASPNIPPAAIPVLFASMPFIALLMSREAAINEIPALVIGISGVALLVAHAVSFSVEQLGAAFLILCAVALGAFSLNYAGKHLRSPDLLRSCLIQFTFAAILLGGVSLATERTQLSVPGPSTILWLLSLGILVSGISLPLLYWLLTKAEPWQAALLQWISTLVAVAEAAWFLRARPSPSQAIGAIAIIGAVVWLLSHHAPLTSPATSSAIQAPTAPKSEVGSK